MTDWDALARKFSGWIPSDLTAQSEIEDALGEANFASKWSRGTRQEFADRISEGRDPSIGERFDALLAQETSMGPEAERTVMVRAEDGTVVGKRENVATWTDRWGNVMAHNEKTGVRKKLE